MSCQHSSSFIQSDRKQGIICIQYLDKYMYLTISKIDLKIHICIQMRLSIEDEDSYIDNKSNNDN